MNPANETLKTLLEKAAASRPLLQPLLHPCKVALALRAGKSQGLCLMTEPSVSGSAVPAPRWGHRGKRSRSGARTTDAVTPGGESLRLRWGSHQGRENHSWRRTKPKPVALAEVRASEARGSAWLPRGPPPRTGLGAAIGLEPTQDAKSRGRLCLQKEIPALYGSCMCICLLYKNNLFFWKKSLQNNPVI